MRFLRAVCALSLVPLSLLLSSCSDTAAAPSVPLNPTIAAFRQKLTNTPTAPTTIVVLGDSIAYGLGDAHGFAYYFAAQLQATYGVGSDTSQQNFTVAQSFAPVACTPTGSWNQFVDFGMAEAGFGAGLSASGSANQLVCPISGDTIRLFGYSTSDGKGAAITIDGVPQPGLFCDVATATPTPCFSEWSGYARGTHTVGITAPNGGTTNFLAAYGRWGNAGVSLLNAAVPETVSTMVADPSHHDWLAGIPNPGLVIFEYGQNDIGGTAAYYQGHVDSLFSYLAANHIPTVALASEWGSVLCGSLSCRADLDAVLKSEAAKYNFPYLSINDRWGGYAAGNAKGFYQDTIHPSDLGNHDIANFLYQSLLQ